MNGPIKGENICKSSDKVLESFTGKEVSKFNANNPLSIDLIVPFSGFHLSIGSD